MTLGSPSTPTSRPPGRTVCASSARYSEARPLYEEAILLTGNDVERAFLAERLHQLPG